MYVCGSIRHSAASACSTTICPEITCHDGSIRTIVKNSHNNDGTNLRWCFGGSDGDDGCDVSNGYNYCDGHASNGCSYCDSHAKLP